MLWTMLLAVMLLAGCSVEDGMPNNAELIVDPTGFSAHGYWTISDKSIYMSYNGTIANGSAISSEISLSNGSVLFWKMPCAYFVGAVVPQQFQQEALASVEAAAYGLRTEVVGHSDDNIYLALERKDYVFTTRYGGQTHEVGLRMGDGGSAVGAIDRSSMSFVMSVNRIMLDGVEAVNYGGNALKLTFFYNLYND